MRKLDLILENIRDEYMINLLEEGTSSELETLKTKKFLNENLNRIRKMLIEEGALEGVKQHLGNNWGKYLAGAGALGAGGLAADAAIDAGEGAIQAGAGDNTMGENLMSGAQIIGDKIVTQAGDIYDQAGAKLGNIADQAQQMGQGLPEEARRAVEAASGMDGDVQAGAYAPVQNIEPRA